MKNLLLLFFIVHLASCNQNSKTDHKTESKAVEDGADQFGWNYIEVPPSYMDSLTLDICTTKDLEFTDLYPIVDSIPSDPYEKLLLVTSLKTIGFEVTNWGRGNWMGGPRIITFTMSNGQCECQVDKLYYSTEEKGRFKITERIRCEG